MQNNKLTLVVDGNWLLMSRYFMKRDTFRMDLPDSVKENSSHQLADLMAQSISVILRQFRDSITNIIFVSDNRSWRKDYPMPLCIESTDTYKGTRKNDETYDWKYIYKSISILSNNLKSIGVTTSNVYGVEGDDWCWWWSRKLNSEGTNVILWTSDEDVKQLIQEDEDTGAFTAWYEKSKGLVFNSSMKPKKFDDEDDELGSFMAPIMPVNNIIKSLSKTASISYANPVNIINKKIYIGDQGDNILPIFTYSKKSKTYKATQKDWSKLINFDTPGYIEKAWYNNLPNLYNEIYKIKTKGDENNITTCDDFVEHAVYNKKMVWLDESQIPREVQSQMTSVEYKEISPNLLHDITYNWRVMSGAESKELEDLFEGEFMFQ